MIVSPKQAFEWIKTGHWTFREFNEWVCQTRNENYLLQQQIEMVRNPGPVMKKLRDGYTDLPQSVK